MHMVTRSLIIAMSGVLITAAMLGARAPDAEAEKAITSFYHRYLTKCGDSWYADITFTMAGSGQGPPRFIHLQRLAVTLMPDHLTTVDALYGIEWRGRAILDALFRAYDPQQQSWSAWQQGRLPIERYPHEILNYELLVCALKSQGQWTIRFPTHAPQRGITINFRSIDCTKLPN